MRIAHIASSTHLIKQMKPIGKSMNVDDRHTDKLNGYKVKRERERERGSEKGSEGRNIQWYTGINNGDFVETTK